MSERNLRQCKACKLLRVRIQDGVFGNSLHKKYRDEQGNLWSGNTCPECNLKRIKKAMKKLREKENAEKQSR